MKQVLKRKQVRVYLNEEDTARLERLVESVGAMNETQVMSTLLTAALKACVEAGNRIPLPLRFGLSEEVEAPVRSVKPAVKTR